MAETQLGELLAIELGTIISEENVGAEVSAETWEGVEGAFIEVRPCAQAAAPAMSIYVLDERSIALAIGRETSTEVSGSQSAILETVRKIANAMFRGQLLETLTRDRQGRVLASKMQLVTDEGTRKLWSRTSVTLRGLWGKKRTTRKLDAYPSR